MKPTRRMAAAAAAMIVLVTAPATVCADPAPLTLRFAPQVRMDQDEIRLGAVADITGADAEMVVRVREVIIARLATAGQKRRFDAALVRLRLKQSGLPWKEIRLQMPAEVVVVRGDQQVPIEWIEQMVLQRIEAQVPWEKAQVQADALTAGLPVTLPSGRLSAAVNLPADSDTLGQIPVAVDLSVNQRLVKRVWVNAHVRAFAQVVVARRPLGRLAPIRAADLDLQEVDLTRAGRDYFTDPQAVIGKRTRRAIRARAVLDGGMVEQPPLVKRGDVVRILAESAGLRITSLAEVRERGGSGDRIQVMNLSSRKRIFARVVDANTVQVDF